MKAAIYTRPGPPDVLHLVERPDPVPAAGEILIRVEAISIEGGDLGARRMQDPGDPPVVIGYAAAGEVVGLGAGVIDFVLGQKVATFAFAGSHAELRTAPANTSWALPEGMDIRDAAVALIGHGTAALALELADIGPDDTVLVQGATGGVGLGAVALAHAAGARVFGSGSRRDALDQLRPHGLSVAVVAGEGTTADQVHAALDGRGVDVLIDTLGGQALLDGMAAVAEGGRVVLVGARAGDSAKIDPMQIAVHRLSVFGCFLGGVMSQPQTRRMMADVLARVASGALPVVIDRIYPLSDAAGAHARAETRGRVGRVVMVPDHLMTAAGS